MEIFKLYFDKNLNLIISLHWIICVIAFVILIIALVRMYRKRWIFYKNIEIDSAEFGIIGQKLKIRPNYMNINIAYKVWVELNTRKIGIKIDFKNDVIYEVYNSWYQFFGITRNLLKELPATKIRLDKDTRELIEISIKILNESLRPHLTMWQAKFRKWYETALKLKENTDRSPQLIQIEYPEYDLLSEDMIRINNNLINYKKTIYKLAFGEKANT